MKIHITQNQLKSERIRLEHSIRQFSKFSKLSGVVIQKIERCEYVNLRTIDKYLLSLSKLSGNVYMFIHEPKKTAYSE